MPKIDKKIELLAPAGNLHKMKTALAFGADAVYVGVPAFSLRVRINDFDLTGIQEAVLYCHAQKKKVYATVNIFAHKRHLEKLPVHVRALRETGVDALIVSDPGVIMVVKKEWPEVELHLSTQANCTNAQSAEFWRSAGIKRIILGREVTLEEIKEISEKCPDIELEYFVHGAMCMAYSGRCFLSKYFTDRSANLGDCIQPCRWPLSGKSQTPSTKIQTKSNNQIQNSKQFSIDGHGEVEIVEEEHGSYILNSKDLCLIKHLQELRDAGVTSFKIEGRAKSAYYQAMVAGIYSEALSKLDKITDKDLSFYYEELESKLVHRGYSTGFLLGEKGDQNLSESHTKCKWEFCGQAMHDANREYANVNRIKVKVHNSLKVGDTIEIVRPKYDIIRMKVEKLYDPETGKEIEEAHGGQDKVVVMKVGGNIPKYSVLRRRL